MGGPLRQQVIQTSLVLTYNNLHHPVMSVSFVPCSIAAGVRPGDTLLASPVGCALLSCREQMAAASA